MTAATPPAVLVWLVLEDLDAVLLGLRKADQPPFAGQWTLPGDRMKEEESAQETISRFGGTELDISVMEYEFVDTLTLADAESSFVANIFRITNYEGSPRFRGGGPYEEVRWAIRSELDEESYPMPEPLRRSLARPSEGETE
jgi:ADP-ribose pyrophosphatase YjhB (NUDIX family)